MRTMKVQLESMMSDVTVPCDCYSWRRFDSSHCSFQISSRAVARIPSTNHFYASDRKGKSRLNIIKQETMSR